MERSKFDRKNVKDFKDYMSLISASGMLCTVNFDLTYKCNLNCIHCYLNKEKKGRLLETEEIKRIIEDLAGYNVVYLIFSGGEIFLREDIFSILDYAAKKRFVIRLKTNGTLITEDIAKRLSRNKYISQIDITLLGSKEKTHDNISQSRGSLLKTINNIRLLVKYFPRKKINIVFTYLKENYQEVHFVKSLAKKIGCKFKEDLGPIFPSWEMSQTEPKLHRLSFEDKIKLIKSSKISIKESSQLLNLANYVCGVGRYTIYIDPFGYAHPCINLYTIDLGYIPKEGIKKIWESRSLKGFKVKNFPKCKDCSLRRFCKICPAINLLENKSFFEPSEETCEYALALKRCSEKRNIHRLNYI